jgi:CubicO group peptidase (beta-lactamase class C family)
VLQLDGAVDDFLPELANRRVLRSIDAALDDTVPAIRSITVEDLLTFRLGFGNIMSEGMAPIQVAEVELDLKTLGPPWPPSAHTPDEWIKHFGTLPLMHQPGEAWMYNTGSQVLGVLIERAAGKPLEAFLRERIFEPLGMVDTGFSVPPEKRDRFTTAYSPNPFGGLDVLDAPDEGSWWANPPAMPNASGWLVSTIDDYWSFVQMILNRGGLRGERVLSEASVDLMTTNQLGRDQREASALFLGGHGWGYCMVTSVAGDAPTVPDGFGWDGGTGTTWRSDVDRDITCILLTQRAMTDPTPPATFTDFFNGAYAALRD